MEFQQVILKFLMLVQDDPRISPAHISIFLAILSVAIRKGGHPEVIVYKKLLTRQAKISGRTYQRCMKDLHQYGYIQYTPSYNPSEGSLVKIKM